MLHCGMLRYAALQRVPCRDTVYESMRHHTHASCVTLLRCDTVTCDITRPP